MESKTYDGAAKPLEAVPSVRLRYVKAYRDRLGRPRYYYRRPGYPSAPLTGALGSDEFMRSYLVAAGEIEPEAPPPKAPKPLVVATIYVVQIRGFDLVKIGYGVDPDRRLAQIEHGAGMPGGLVTLHRMRGHRGTERALHARFADQRLFGEWFRLSGPVAEWLSTLTAAEAA